MVVPQLRCMASRRCPRLSLRSASLAALSTSSIERTPCTKNPSSVENPFSLRPGSRSIITTMVACSRAWLRRSILFPSTALSCLGYTNSLPTACNENRIGSKNGERDTKNATNKTSTRATCSYFPRRGYILRRIISQVSARFAPRISSPVQRFTSPSSATEVPAQILPTGTIRAPRGPPAGRAHPAPAPRLPPGTRRRPCGAVDGGYTPPQSRPRHTKRREPPAEPQNPTDPVRAGFNPARATRGNRRPQRPRTQRANPLEVHLGRSFEVLHQPEGRPGDPPVALPVARLSHRKVVREGDEGDAGATTPRSMASVTVGMPRPSMASHTRPTARWQSGQEGVSRTASTPSSTSLSATSGAVLSRSGRSD